jgi:hypothetical protein
MAIFRSMDFFRLVLLLALTSCVVLSQQNVFDTVQGFDNIVFQGVAMSQGSCLYNRCASLEDRVLKELSPRCDEGCDSLDFQRIFDALVPTDAEAVYKRMLPPMPKKSIGQFYVEVYSQLRRDSVLRDDAARIPTNNFDGLQREILALKRRLVNKTKRSYAGDPWRDLCFGVDWFPMWSVYRTTTGLSLGLQRLCLSNAATYRKLDDARTRLFQTLMWQNGLLRRMLAICPLCRFVLCC